MGSGSSVAICPYDKKPCDRFIYGISACSVSTFGVVGDSGVSNCPRFPDLKSARKKLLRK